MSRIFPALLLIAASAISHGAWAATDKENTYGVEVLVFATRLPQLDGDELWTRETTTAPENLDAETPGPAASSGILANAATELNKDGRFRILAYYNWIQSADAKSASKPIRLRGTNARSADELSGTLRLYLSRYLHLDLNLNYAEKTADSGQSNADADKVVYHINEQRRIKSQETHYFDHPKFGVLLRLTPLNTGR